MFSFYFVNLWLHEAVLNNQHPVCVHAFLKKRGIIKKKLETKFPENSKEMAYKYLRARARTHTYVGLYMEKVTNLHMLLQSNNNNNVCSIRGFKIINWIVWICLSIYLVHLLMFCSALPCRDLENKCQICLLMAKILSSLLDFIPQQTANLLQ